MEVVTSRRPFQTTIPNFLRPSTLEREYGYWCATEPVASGGNLKLGPSGPSHWSVQAVILYQATTASFHVLFISLPAYHYTLHSLIYWQYSQIRYIQTSSDSNSLVNARYQWRPVDALLLSRPLIHTCRGDMLCCVNALCKPRRTRGWPLKRQPSGYTWHDRQTAQIAAYLNKLFV
jgi:hypothetical protein